MTSKEKEREREREREREKEREKMWEKDNSPSFLLHMQRHI